MIDHRRHPMHKDNTELKNSIFLCGHTSRRLTEKYLNTLILVLTDIIICQVQITVQERL